MWGDIGDTTLNNSEVIECCLKYLFSVLHFLDGLGLGLAGERLVAGSFPTGPDQAQLEGATWARPPVGSPLTGGFRRGRCNVIWVAVVGGGPSDPIPGR